MAKVECNVSVEVVVVSSLKTFVQEISDKYGITIEQVNFDWARLTGGGSHLLDLELLLKG